MSTGLKNPDPNSEIFFVSFNQDATCISVGTRNGYRIYNSDPFGKCFHEAEGGIGLVQMLYCTSLVVLVGAGEQPAFSPRRLRVWNTKSMKSICDLNFVTAVLAVQLNRHRMIVVLEKQIYIFDVQSMQILETLDIAPNPRAIFALSVDGDASHLAFPTAVPGEIILYDANNLNVQNAIQVHRSAPIALAFNSNGTLLASASETVYTYLYVLLHPEVCEFGTILRVFEVPGGKKKFSFRRGSYSAQIFGLAFNKASTLLCASSDTGTIHIFSLTGLESSTTGSFGQFSPLISTGNAPCPPISTGPNITQTTYKTQSMPPSHQNQSKKGNATQLEDISGVVSSYIPSSLKNFVEGTRDFAFARLRDTGVSHLCALHGPEPNETSAKVLVITSDGYFYQYGVDLTVGGECRLEREHVLRDSISEEIQATYLE